MKKNYSYLVLFFSIMFLVILFYNRYKGYTLLESVFWGFITSLITTIVVYFFNRKKDNNA